MVAPSRFSVGGAFEISYNYSVNRADMPQKQKLHHRHLKN